MLLQPKTFNLQPTRAGFTIIELLVAIGLFSVVVAIAVGGFARALHTQRQTALLLAANSNASEMLEAIAREIRTGENFEVTSGPGFKFLSARNELVTYRLDNHRIMRQGGSSPSQPVSGDNVSVMRFDIAVSRTGNAGEFGRKDGYPPLITIVVGVAPSSTDPGISGSIVNLQTTVSSRLPDDSPAQLLVQKFVDSTNGGNAQPSDFTMAVVGYHVRPCETPEQYAASLSSDPAVQQKTVDTIRNDPQQGLTREPTSADPLGGVCRTMIQRTGSDKPDVCLSVGSSTGTWVAMARGEYCVDELWSSYHKSFEGSAAQDPKVVGDCAKENTGGIDSIEVSQDKICVVRNIAPAPPQ